MSHPFQAGHHPDHPKSAVCEGASPWHCELILMEVADWI